MKINKIKISGFKSIADVELNDLTPFSVFVGANGAGKSNFFDALKFLSTVISNDVPQALAQFGGYGDVHCFKFQGEKAKTFLAEVEGQNLKQETLMYRLKVYDMDINPKLEEKEIIDKNIQFSREKDAKLEISMGDMSFPIPNHVPLLGLQNYSILSQYIKNIKIYRIDPLGAKEPNTFFTTNSFELESNGHNIAVMLSILEKDDEIREQIIEWMELLVPSLETVSTEHSRFDSGTLIKFKEAGIKKHFPAHLISDGTIYALCIMVAVLGRSKQPGMTLIEEPERGIHPQAIAELVNLMRENANPNHAIFVTTHSESVVRHSRPEELWLVNKIDGKTEFKNAGKKFSNLGDLSLDKAWLMNFFGGGLPW